MKIVIDEDVTMLVSDVDLVVQCSGVTENPCHDLYLDHEFSDT